MYKGAGDKPKIVLSNHFVTMFDSKSLYNVYVDVVELSLSGDCSVLSLDPGQISSFPKNNSIFSNISIFVIRYN